MGTQKFNGKNFVYMNVELQSAAEFRPLIAVKQLPSLICAVKHQQHVFIPFVFEQFLTLVPIPSSVSEEAYFTSCTLNKGKSHYFLHSFHKHTTIFTTMFLNIMTTVTSSRTAVSLLGSPSVSTALKQGTSKLSDHV